MSQKPLPPTPLPAIPSNSRTSQTKSSLAHKHGGGSWLVKSALIFLAPSLHVLYLFAVRFTLRKASLSIENETYSAVSSHAAAAYAASALLTLLSRNLKIGFSTK